MAMNKKEKTYVKKLELELKFAEDLYKIDKIIKELQDEI